MSTHSIGSGDLTFWVEYEQILYELSVTPPNNGQLKARFSELLALLTNPDLIGICLRNLALLSFANKEESTAIVYLKRALEVTQNKVVRLQVLLILSLYGIKVANWQLSFLELKENPPSEAVRKYAAALMDQYHRCLQVKSEEKEIDYLSLISDPL